MNIYTLGSQRDHSVSSDAAGDFVVVWQSHGHQDGNMYGVIGRRYDADGTPLSGEFIVNAYTTGDQRRPVVAKAPAGAFMVAWQSTGQDGSSYGIFGQFYDASGVAQGSELRVSTTTSGSQSQPAVAAVADGFVWSGAARTSPATASGGSASTRRVLPWVRNFS